MQRICYLAARMRLLRTHQMSQPGTVSYAWADPYAMLSAMQLEPGDVIVLAQFLADDSFLPTYSYWRNFHPQRTLHRASWAIAELIHEAAGEKIVDVTELESLGPDGVRRVIERVTAWCDGR